jgi:tetratricopeptide (TPR) repeat protein
LLQLKNRFVIVFVAFLCAAILLGFCIFNLPSLQADRIIVSCNRSAGTGTIAITNPLDSCIFPPEIASPTVRWSDTSSRNDRWLVSIRFGKGSSRMNIFTAKNEWRPDNTQWETIKKYSVDSFAHLKVIGLNGGRVLGRGEIAFTTSKDRVDDPIFYREVTLPFADAVKDPSRIRWRFGAVSQERLPPVVLTNLPVCGNCHSFSADGSILGMDVDYGNDKGAYALTAVAKRMRLAVSDIISWSDYKREDGQPTFGLLSQVSPDGRFVASTVKDISVFVPRSDLMFSQLFFPIKGIILIYSRLDRTFAPLPGADDTAFVQSNPAWTADGKYLVFTKSKVYHLRKKHDTNKLLLSEDECREFLTRETLFRYDLFRIPFNNGAGGKAEPLRGASGDGMSNYFPKFSPDGKWIVFCKAQSFMLLQPDSRLYLMPASGGEPRLMRCNTDRMNSWHSWSSNSRWIVFSSKANSAYTQLFITHVDENGNDAPPVLLEQFTSPDRAANIPEFINAAPGAIAKIQEQFIDDVSLWRAGKNFEEAGDFVHAEEKFREALSINPKNPKPHLSLGKLFETEGKLQSAFAEYSTALALDSSAMSRINLGNALLGMGNYDGAIDQYSHALDKSKNDSYAQYNLAFALYKKGSLDQALGRFREGERAHPGDAGFPLGAGRACYRLGNMREAAAYFREGVRLEPSDAEGHFLLGCALAAEGNTGKAIDQYHEALRLRPDYPEARDSLAAISNAVSSMLR